MSLSPFRNLSGRSLTVTVDCSRQTRLLRLRKGETEVNEDGTASGRRNGQTLRFQALWSPAIRAVQKAACGDLDFGDLSPPVSPRREVVSRVYPSGRRSHAASAGARGHPLHHNVHAVQQPVSCNRCYYFAFRIHTTNPIVDEFRDKQISVPINR